ncbi:hypothetical protein DIPPA_17063 [Diplonema papillatum]|nr:hypothetical protein DIPPA_17063 [Diplonema papillatum]|eukprot:gene22566-34535_t
MGNMKDPREETPVTGVVVNGGYGADCAVPAVPLATSSQVIVVEETGKEDYFPACLGTAVFGVFGVIGTLLCCPSNHGKLGAASGCAWWQIWTLLVVFTFLILIGVHAIDCDKFIYPDEISQHKCSEIGGTWSTIRGACFDACPDDYDVTTDPVKKGWAQYCEHSDPTCVGMTKSQVTVHIVISFVILCCAVYYIKFYAKRIREQPQYETI